MSLDACLPVVDQSDWMLSSESTSSSRSPMRDVPVSSSGSMSQQQQTSSLVTSSCSITASNTIITTTITPSTGTMSPDGSNNGATSVVDSIIQTNQTIVVECPDVEDDPTLQPEPNQKLLTNCPEKPTDVSTISEQGVNKPSDVQQLSNPIHQVSPSSVIHPHHHHHSPVPESSTATLLGKFISPSTPTTAPRAFTPVTVTPSTLFANNRVIVLTVAPPPPAAAATAPIPRDQNEEDHCYAMNLFRQHSHLSPAECLRVASEMSDEKFAEFRPEFDQARTMWHCTSKQIHKAAQQNYRVQTMTVKFGGGSARPPTTKRNQKACNRIRLTNPVKLNNLKKRGAQKKTAPAPASPLTTTIIEISDDENSQHQQDQMEPLSEQKQMEQEQEEEDVTLEGQCLEEYLDNSGMPSSVPTSCTGPIVTNIITQIGPNHNKILKSKRAVLPSVSQRPKRKYSARKSVSILEQQPPPHSNMVPNEARPTSPKLCHPVSSNSKKISISMDSKSIAYFGQNSSASSAGVKSAPISAQLCPPVSVAGPSQHQHKVAPSMFDNNNNNGNTSNCTTGYGSNGPHYESYPNSNPSFPQQLSKPETLSSVDFYYPDVNNNEDRAVKQPQPQPHSLEDSLNSTQSSAFGLPTPYDDYLEASKTSGSGVNSNSFAEDNYGFGSRPGYFHSSSFSNNVSYCTPIQNGSTVHWVNNDCLVPSQHGPFQNGWNSSSIPFPDYPNAPSYLPGNYGQMLPPSSQSKTILSGPGFHPDGQHYYRQSTPPPGDQYLCPQLFANPSQPGSSGSGPCHQSSSGSTSLPSFNEVRLSIKAQQQQQQSTTVTGVGNSLNHQFEMMDHSQMMFGDDNNHNHNNNNSNSDLSDLCGPEPKSMSENDLEILNSLIMSLQSESDFSL